MDCILCPPPSLGSHVKEVERLQQFRAKKKWGKPKVEDIYGALLFGQPYHHNCHHFHVVYWANIGYPRYIFVRSSGEAFMIIDNVILVRLPLDVIHHHHHQLHLKRSITEHNCWHPLLRGRFGSTQRLCCCNKIILVSITLSKSKWSSLFSNERKMGLLASLPWMRWCGEFKCSSSS